MRYQIKGSTITFTNTSVQKENVTGYEWFLDSGSGYVSQGTNENQAITFPNTGGITCTVRQVVKGSWGADIVKDNQYTTVENVAPPTIVVPSGLAAATFYSGVPVSYFFEVTAGTGAGDLVWSTEGVAGSLIVNSATGELSGTVYVPDNSGFILSIRVIVTDALGRKAYYDIQKIVYRNDGVAAAYSADYGIEQNTEAGRVSKWNSRNPGHYLNQVTAVQQPVYIANDGNGKACVRFNQLVHNLIPFSVWTTYYSLLAVVKVKGVASTGTNFIFHRAYADGIVKALDNSLHFYYSQYAPKNIPMTDLEIWSLYYGTALAGRAYFTDNGNWRRYKDVSYMSAFTTSFGGMGHSSEAGIFDVYDYIVMSGGIAGGGSQLFTNAKIIMRGLSVKYGIPLNEADMAAVPSS